MKCLTTIAALSLVVGLSALALAGEAKTSRTFRIGGEFSGVAAWYDEHRAGVFEASNCEILEVGKEGRYLVKSETPLGDWKYVVQETIESSDEQFVIRIVLADKLRTDIREQVVTISIKPARGGLEFTMAMEQDVRSSFVPSFALKRSQQNSLRGCESYLKENVR